VTGDTEVECESAPATAPAAKKSSDDDKSDRNDDHGDDDHGDDDHGDDDEDCGTDPFTAGRAVREAELKAGGAGAVWEEIKLL
jgi:hypothetical protein